MSADPLVLITDYAWPDLELERDLLAAAGVRLVAGPGPLIDADAVEALVVAHRPAAILTNWARVSAAAIRAAPGLRMVGRLGVGLDNIDVAAATSVGAWVTNVPDYCVEEVSDHAIGLMLAWARGIVRFDRAVRRGEWRPESARLRRVADLTVAILGFGRIGRRTAEKLAPFGCAVIPVRRDTPLEAALGAADVVIVHLPGTAETFHLLDAARLAALKPGALLINVGRGSVVDGTALRAALAAGQLSAALDVLEEEPTPPADLLMHEAVIITPHIAFTSDASLLDLRRRGVEEAVRVLRGEPPAYPCNVPR